MDNVLSAIPQGITRDEWLQALPRALVAGFVKTDIEFQQKGMYQYIFFGLFFFSYYNDFVFLLYVCVIAFVVLTFMI